MTLLRNLNLKKKSIDNRKFLSKHESIRGFQVFLSKITWKILEVLLKYDFSWNLIRKTFPLLEAHSLLKTLSKNGSHLVIIFSKPKNAIFLN
jgi:hypothetical protein